MKIYKWIVWISIAIAVLFIFITGICFVFNLNLCGVRHIVNFLHTANSFLLLAIAIHYLTSEYRLTNKV
jgi:hypothetical protein